MNRAEGAPAGGDGLMIKALEIENFKGIGERQRIEFAPITLLFGPNSAGKSTVIQSLIYAHDLLWQDNIDADLTKKGGSHVSLGGFRSFVHKRELDRTVSMRFELPYTSGIPMLGDDFYKLEGSSYEDYFCLKFGAYTIEVGLSWNSRLGKPVGTVFEIDFNGVWIASARAEEDASRVTISGINWVHPNFLFEKELLKNIVEKLNHERQGASQAAYCGSGLFTQYLGPRVSRRTRQKKGVRGSA